MGERQRRRGQDQAERDSPTLLKKVHRRWAGALFTQTFHPFSDQSGSIKVPP
jgi:hypothetical protein